jgi:hypothetical protein
MHQEIKVQIIKTIVEVSLKTYDHTYVKDHVDASSCRGLRLL